MEIVPSLKTFDDKYGSILYFSLSLYFASQFSPNFSKLSSFAILWEPKLYEACLSFFYKLPSYIPILYINLPFLQHRLLHWKEDRPKIYSSIYEDNGILSSLYISRFSPQHIIYSHSSPNESLCNSLFIALYCLHFLSKHPLLNPEIYLFLLNKIISIILSDHFFQNLMVKVYLYFYWNLVLPSCNTHSQHSSPTPILPTNLQPPLSPSLFPLQKRAGLQESIYK